MSILSKASLVQIPSGYGEDNLYSEVPNTTAGDFTFTRASTGTRVNADGYIEEVPWNKLGYSEDFSSWGTWQQGAALTPTLTTDAVNSPIGTLTADRLQCDQVSTGSPNRVGKSFNFSSTESSFGLSQRITLSCWVKSASGSDEDFSLYIRNATLIDATYNLIATNEWQRFELEYETRSYDVSIQVIIGLFQHPTTTTNDIYIWGAQLVKGTSPKPYIKTTDRLDIPRLDYSGGATCPTLLLEPQRTNTILNSEDLSQNTILNNVTVTTNQTTSPDNTNTADRLDYGSGSGFFYKQSSVSVISSYTIFVKYIDYQYFQLMCSGDVDHYANFDIQNGIVGNVGSQSTASIEDYGNGWYRCTLNMTAGTFAGGSARLYKVTSLTAGWAGGGGGVGSVYVWGLQLESGSFPTSYIPTSGTSVTRNAEACYVLNNTDVIGQEEGVVFIDFVFTGIIETYSIFKFSQNASNANRLQLYFQNTELIVLSRSTSGGAITQNIENPTIIGKRYKVAIQYKDLDFKVYLNGSEVYTNTSAYSPDGMNQVTFSNGGTSTLFGFFNDIKQVALFKEALTDTELTALTTI